jgi:acetolactate synthase-1/3 small subunit
LKDEEQFTYLQASGPQYTMDNLIDDLSSYNIEQIARTGSAGII